MEKTASKPVDRQATFDTDPHRAHLAKGNLKLPVIGTQDIDLRKTETVENKNKQSKRQDNASNEQKGKPPVPSSKNETIGKDPKVTVPAVKISDSSIKSNVLSNINKKKANHEDKELKGVGNSKDNSKKTPDNIKNTHTSKSNSVTKHHDKSVADPPEQKVTGARTSVLAKSSSQKVKETKAVDKQQTTGNTKIDTSQKNGGTTNRITQQTNKSVNGHESKSKGSVENRSRSPEKHQSSKAAVLKGLNNKGIVSPTKGRNTSPHKEFKSSAEDVKITNQTSKTVTSKQPLNKGPNTDDKNHKISPRKQDNTNQGPIIKQTKEIASPRRKTDNTQSYTGVSKETKVSSKSTPLPVNNAPVETLLLNGEQNDKIEERNVKISPRAKVQNEKHSLSVGSDAKQNSNKHSTNEETKQPLNKPVADGLKQSVKGGTSQSYGLNINNEKAEQNQEPEQSNVNADTRVSIRGSYSHETQNEQTDKVLNSSVQSKNETYVLSPSPTKFDAKSPKRVSRPGRLSPSNESVEPIRLEQKPSTEKAGMDVDRRESYAQVFAERNTLLNAEYTYRKRIKQLEDEANGFLKAIDELTTENKYLRDRVDALEDELLARGSLEKVDKISELEKNRVALESKIKELEKSSKASDNTEELKEQVVKLQSKNQALHEENSKLKSENTENAKKLRALEAEKKSLETSVTDVESEKLDKIQGLGKEQKQLNKQLNDLKAKNKGLEKKVDALEYENKTLSDTLAKKKTELTELLGVMKDENKFDNEVKELNNRILKLSKEKKEAELAFNKEKRALNEKLKDVKASLDNKTKDTDELKIKLDEVESEHKKMKVDFDPMKRLVESQKKEIAKLKQEIERLQQELTERNENYEKLENESASASEDLKEAKDQLEQFNKELQKIVSDKESQVSKLINQLDTMREERENERKLSKEEKEKLASETEKVETYQVNTRRLEADLKNFAEKLDESTLKEKQLTIQLEDKGFQVSNLEHQLFEMNMKMENYSKRMSEVDREKREMEREKREWEVKKDKIDDIEASNKRLLEENKRLRNQLEMTSYLSTHRQPERNISEKPVVEAWVNEKNSQAINQALYVQKEKQKDNRKKKVHLVQQQPSTQKKRMPLSRSSPVKVSRQHKHEEIKVSNPSTHRSLEDLRKVEDTKTPESEHSLPELTIGYGSMVGYSQIHKNRIRAAHKGIYHIH